MIKSILARAATSLGLVLATAALVASPAQAATQYNDAKFVVAPTVYQTNFYYSSPSVASTVTPTGTINQVGYAYSFNSSIPTGTTMQVEICNEPSTGVARICTAVTGNGAGGWTSAFNGLSSTTKFYYRFYLSSPTTKAINPPVYGANNRITIGFIQP
ncbi:flagellar protein FlhE [Aquipuribacter hungaricus]|uniref:Flagellar protein FlhE n=1 Tax=Aquipuribacter hungaricus TaxID=545624 RepID=A0ABV7WK71_9MICO